MYVMYLITVLQTEVGLAPNNSNVIRNIAKAMAPREKIALSLMSVQDVPFGGDHCK